MVKKRELIPTGNEELDLKLGGGFPYPSLILIEGEHGSGKTALIQQFVYGALKQGKRVWVFTTELTVKEFLMSARELQVDMKNHFIRGRLTIYSLQLSGVKWISKYAALLLPMIGSYISVHEDRYDLLVIDSLTHLGIYSLPSSFLNFITKVRVLVSKGKGIILTLHPKSIREDLAVRIRGVCDGYIKLSIEAFGGRLVKVMSIIKMRGLPAGAETAITFDVDPAMGIKIIPIKVAKA